MAASGNWKVNDRVMIHPDVVTPEFRGVVFEVIELPKGSRGVNYRMRDLTTQKVLRCRGDLLIEAPAEGSSGPDAVRLSLQAFEDPIHIGEVVTISGLGWKQPAQNLYVVLSQRSDGQYKVARLGGDNDRYYPKIPRSMLTRVTVPTTLG